MEGSKSSDSEVKKTPIKGHRKTKRSPTTKQVKDKGKEDPLFDEEKEEEKVVELKTSKDVILHVMEFKLYVNLMIICTVLALFMPDIWEAAGPPPISWDIILYATMMVCLLFFMSEIVLLSWARDDYLFSFFFWLDSAAALSLFPEALMVFNVDILKLLGNNSTTLSLTRAGRAARAGTRAVRIMTLVKSAFEKWMSRKDENRSAKKQSQEESAIGGKLAAGITEKVILVVTAMLVANLLISGSIGTATEPALENAFTTLEELYRDCGGGNSSLSGGVAGCRTIRTDCMDGVPTDDPTCHFNLFFRLFVIKNNGDMGCPTINTGLTGSDLDSATRTALACRLQVFQREYNFSNYSTSATCETQVIRSLRILGDWLWCGPEAEDSLRFAELQEVIIESGSRVALADIPYTRGSAVSNILQVLFIIILLGCSSYFFHLDAERLVIGPISKMAKLVDRLNKNPLAPIEESADTGMEEFETGFVERALRKFGKLIQIAFGEAGADVLSKDNTISTDGITTSTFVAGRKMQAIFGFAIVNNFNACTECLQEDTMLFVNTIADIVHRACHDNQGAPNKNIGDSFLLVWRLDDDADISKPVGDIADDAVKSFIRASMEVQASEVLRKMTESPKIQEAIPGYRVTLGFGLHVGWGIEGAIGSMLKIDASYLSPNVNLAARLESGTHQFKVDILLSDKVFNMLSPDVQALHRKIDCVTMKGSQLPITIYTYDVPYFGATTMGELYAHEDPDMDFWDNFPPRTSSTFRKRHAEGVRLYLEGNWSESRKLLEMCIQENGDGPSKVLLDVMGAKKFIAPDGWKGWRELTSK